MSMIIPLRRRESCAHSLSRAVALGPGDGDRDAVVPLLEPINSHVVVPCRCLGRQLAADTKRTHQKRHARWFLVADEFGVVCRS
jgi:hypothetical protein